MTHLSKRKKLTIIITSCIFVGSIIIGILIPVNMSDGTEKFQDKDKELATLALKTYVEESTIDIEKVGAFGVFKFKVDSVMKEDSFGTGIGSKCNPHYEVQISERTFFGLISHSASRPICAADLSL